MIREYGSNFEWLPLPDKIINSLKSNEKIAYLRSGRECLYFIGEYAQKRKINKVVMPSLCCPAMVQPYKQLGFQVSYYKINEDLTINIRNLQAALDDNSILLFMHYYGRQSYSSEEVKEIVSQFSNVITVQDCTQNYFTESLYNPIADFYVGSLRKWVSVTDGAEIRSSVVELPNWNSSDEEFASRELAAMKKKYEYLQSGDATLKDAYRTEFSQCTSQLRSHVDISTMSNISKNLFQRMDRALIKKTRRENYNHLVQTVGDAFPDIVRYCVNQECPLCFPIVVENRDSVQSKLSQRNVYAQVLWPLPDGEACKCTNSVWFSDHMLAVPCDQRYSASDMKYIAETIIEVLKDSL